MKNFIFKNTILEIFKRLEVIFKGVSTGVMLLLSAKKRIAIMHPKTLEEAIVAVHYLIDSLYKHDKEYLLKLKSGLDFISCLDSSVGIKIRRIWNLYDQNSLLFTDIKDRFGLNRPRDISGFILHCAHIELTQGFLSQIKKENLASYHKHYQSKIQHVIGKGKINENE